MFAKSSSMSWPRNMIRSRYIRLNTSIHCAWSIPTGNLYGILPRAPSWASSQGAAGRTRRRPQRRGVARLGRNGGSRARDHSAAPGVAGGARRHARTDATLFNSAATIGGDGRLAARAFPLVVVPVVVALAAMLCARVAAPPPRRCHPSSALRPTSSSRRTLPTLGASPPFARPSAAASSARSAAARGCTRASSSACTRTTTSRSSTSSGPRPRGRSQNPTPAASVGGGPLQARRPASPSGCVGDAAAPRAMTRRRQRTVACAHAGAHEDLQRQRADAIRLVERRVGDAPEIVSGYRRRNARETPRR